MDGEIVEYDYINPSHYQANVKQPWEMMIDIWGKEKFIAFCQMNAFKYRMRLGLKPDQSIEREVDKINWYEEKANELINLNP